MEEETKPFVERNRETKCTITWDREIDALLHLLTQEFNVEPSELLLESFIQYIYRHRNALAKEHREYLLFFYYDGCPGVDLNLGKITKQLEDRKPEPELEENEILDSKQRNWSEARDKWARDFI